MFFWPGWKEEGRNTHGICEATLLIKNKRTKAKAKKTPKTHARAQAAARSIGAPMPIDWAHYKARLADLTRLSSVLGWRQAQYLRKMLRDFEHKALAIVRRLERVQNLGQMTVELHVDDGADDLRDAARGLISGSHGSSPFLIGSKRLGA